jgi:hypothetical protein
MTKKGKNRNPFPRVKRRKIGLDEHLQISRDLKRIEKLTRRLLLQFGTATRRSVGPYSSLQRIAHFTDRARRRSSLVLRLDHPKAAPEDLYGLWE